MGAGCAYRLEDDSDQVAFWYEYELFNPDEFEDEDELQEQNEFAQNFAFETIRDLVLSYPTRSGWGMYKESEYEIGFGDNYTVKLESTHDGKGILIQMELRDTDYALAKANYVKSYLALMAYVNKQVELWAGHDAWCPCKYEIGEVQ